MRHGLPHFMELPAGRIVRISGCGSARLLPNALVAHLACAEGDLIVPAEDGDGCPWFALTVGTSPLVGRVGRVVVKPPVTLLDCTLRDGSYAMNYRFTAQQTAGICTALEADGVRMIEIGHGVCLNGSRARYGIGRD